MPQKSRQISLFVNKKTERRQNKIHFKMALFHRTKILNCLWIRYLSSTEISLRHVNPFRLKKDQIVQEIFQKLQPKYIETKPKIEDLDRILDLFKLEDQDKCLEIYKSYAGKSSLAFYLLANPDLNQGKNKFTFASAKFLNLSKNSHFENLIFDKFTFSKFHFS